MLALLSQIKNKIIILFTQFSYAYWLERNSSNNKK